MSTKKRLLSLVTLIALLTAGGVAYAYWTAGGTGTGSGTTGSNNPITVNQTNPPANLFPGGPAQALTGTFNNTNPGPTYVGSVVITIASVTKAAGVPDTLPCDKTDYAIVTGSAGTGTSDTGTATVNTDVPSGNPQGAWGSANGPALRLINKPSNQDGCKGATVNLNFAISNP